MIGYIPASSPCAPCTRDCAMLSHSYIASQAIHETPYSTRGGAYGVRSHPRRLPEAHPRRATPQADLPARKRCFIARCMEDYHRDPSTLIASDADRSFHLVALATETIDYRLPSSPTMPRRIASPLPRKHSCAKPASSIRRTGTRSACSRRSPPPRTTNTSRTSLSIAPRWKSGTPGRARGSRSL